jgi:predicted aspartyl protease
MPKLTIKRAHPKDAIRFEVHVFNPISEAGARATALFDTGNDHTVVSKALADRLGLSPTGQPLSVHGVTGHSTAQIALATLGIEFDGGHKCEIINHEVAILDGTSDDVLIGRDFLERFDVTISRDGEFTLER